MINRSSGMKSRRNTRKRSSYEHDSWPIYYLLNYIVMSKFVNSKSAGKNKQVFDDSDHMESRVSPEIKSIIRKKVSSYLLTHLDLLPQHSRHISGPKKSKPPMPK
jgi:cAMP phosphodiesterase